MGARPLCRVAVLISGRGSNLQALMEACEEPDCPAEIVAVISNRADAAGLKRAQEAGIPTAVISHKDYDGREAFDAGLDAALTSYAPDLVCLAGFMRILTPGFVRRWEGRVLNIHPSLLPAFKGLETHARALAAGCRFAGCTVHFVAAEVDSGPIVIQAAVPIAPDDTPDSLAERVLIYEHRCYAQALTWFVQGRLLIEGEHVRVEGTTPPVTGLLNPQQWEER